MFIKWRPVWGSRKKCWTSDLTVIWQASESKIFNWLKETIAHYKGFLQCKKPLKKRWIKPAAYFPECFGRWWWSCIEYGTFDIYSTAQNVQLPFVCRYYITRGKIVSKIIKYPQLVSAELCSSVVMLYDDDDDDICSYGYW